MSTIRSRWTAKLKGREALLSQARARVAYWSTRAGSSHGAAMLKQRVAERTIREKQVAEARKVLARHPGEVTGLSAEGLAFIAAREGFRARPYYPTPGDRLTIGYGETKNVKPGMKWTRSYALDRLRARADRDYGLPVLMLAKDIGLALKQHEYDALCSLVYNLGPGILGPGKSMGQALRSKRRDKIAAAFLVYVGGPDGKPMLGLKLRRKAERNMFLRG